jgi:hypothetical protein
MKTALLVILALVTLASAQVSASEIAINGTTAMIASEGCVDIYDIKDGKLQLKQKLRHSETFGIESHPVRFGCSVDVDGDRAAVGAFGGGGSVFVYHRTNDLWQLEQRIFPDAELYAFASQVSLSGNTLLVGTVEPDTPDHKTSGVCVFERDESGVWQQTESLTAPDESEFSHFGYAIDIDKDMAIVSARDSTSQTDKPADHEFRQVGSVHIFAKSANGWQRQSVIRPDRAAFRFGSALKRAGDRLLVTASSVGLNAFVYQLTEGSWTQAESLQQSKAPNYMGDLLDFDGETAVFGDPHSGKVAIYSTKKDAEFDCNARAVAVSNGLVIVSEQMVAKVFQRNGEGGGWAQVQKLPFPAP